jgi:hypothetical protein
LVTCLFSFGSTGEPKPLWFDARRWAGRRSSQKQVVVVIVVVVVVVVVVGR